METRKGNRRRLEDAGAERAGRLARRLGAGSGWLPRELAASAYAAYVLHVFMLVALQRALLPCDWPGAAKFGVVVVAGTVWTFGTAALLRRVPGLRSVF